MKAAAVSANGNSVTVRADENADLTDFFDYIKIEEDSSDATVTVDNSNLDEGVSYLGSGSESSAASTEHEMQADEGRQGNYEHAKAEPEREMGALKEDTVSRTVEFSYEEKKTENWKMSGTVKIGFTATVSFYIAQDYKSISFNLDTATFFSVKSTMETDLFRKEFGKVSVTMGAGIKVGFTPALVLKLSGEIEWDGTVHGRIGFKYDQRYGFTNTSVRPYTTSDITVEGSLLVGLEIDPFVALIHEKLCRAYAECTIGIKVKATQKYPFGESEEYMHECRFCLDGRNVLMFPT